MNRFGIAMYAREEEARWRKDAPDCGLASCDSYEEWEAQARRILTWLREQGAAVEEVPVTVDGFLAWRAAGGRGSVDAYAVDCLRTKRASGMAGTWGAESTEALVTRFARCGLDVPDGLPTELVRRPDAGTDLADLVRQAKYWSLRGPGRGWAPIHALPLLGARREPEGLAAFLDVLRYHPDDLGDWLTEDVPGWLAAFGPPAVPEIEAVVADEAVDPYARDAAGRALAAVAHLHPELRPRVADRLLAVAEATKDPILPATLACTLADLRVPDVKDRLRALFDAGKVEDSIVGWDTVEALYAGTMPSELGRDTKDPMAHFAREELDRLKEIEAEGATVAGRAAAADGRRPKVGRNEPCPCGSGRKYKKCHGRPGESLLAARARGRP